MKGHRVETISLALLAAGWVSLMLGTLVIGTWLVLLAGGQVFVLETPLVLQLVYLLDWIMLLAALCAAAGLAGLVLRKVGVLGPVPPPGPDPILTIDVDRLRQRTGHLTFLVWWLTPPHVAVDSRLRSTPRLRAWHVWVETVNLRLLRHTFASYGFGVLQRTGIGLLLFTFSPSAFLPRDEPAPSGGGASLASMIPAAAHALGSEEPI